MEHKCPKCGGEIIEQKHKRIVYMEGIEIMTTYLCKVCGWSVSLTNMIYNVASGTVLNQYNYQWDELNINDLYCESCIDSLGLNLDSDV